MSDLLRFKTSKATADRIEKISETLAQSGTKLGIASLAKICFGISLRENKNNLKLENNGNDGKEILDSHFLGKEAGFYRAICDMVYNKNLTDQEFFSHYGVVKYHVDRGSEMLFSMFEEVKRDAEAFKDKLLDLVD